MADPIITLPGVGDVPGIAIPQPTSGGITLPGVGSGLTEGELEKREKDAYERGRDSMTLIVVGAGLVGALVGFFAAR